MFVCLTIRTMSRIATVFVVVIILLAGCSGAPTGSEDRVDNTNGEGDTEQKDEIVTYSNETGDTTVKMVVNHNIESFNLWVNGTVESTGEFNRNYTIGLYCEVVEQTAYNHSDSEKSVAGSEYTKSANGMSETVEGLPENVLENYEPATLKATIYDDNGTKLNTCTVTGEGEFSHETNAD